MLIIGGHAGRSYGISLQSSAFSLQPKYLSSYYHVNGYVPRLRKSHRTLLKILHDHGPLHRPEMQITVVGKDSRIIKNMLKALPRFVHR